jgi:hypothetical protein
MSKQQVNEKVETIETTDQCDHNDESGDLSEWKHLTATYDDDTMFACNDDHLRPSGESVDHDLLLYNQLYHQQQCNTASSLSNDDSKHSQPAPQNRTGFASDKTIIGGLTAQFFEDPNFLSGQSAQIHDRIANDHGLFDALELTLHSHYQSDHNMPIEFQDMSPSKSSDKSTSLQQYQTMYGGSHKVDNLFEPTPIDPLLSLLNRTENNIDFNPQVEFEYDNMSAAPDESKPHATGAMDSIHINECIDTTNAVTTSNNPTFSVPNRLVTMVHTAMRQGGSSPSRDGYVPHAIRASFLPTEQEEIHRWMTIPMGSFTQLQPTYEELSDKKLLLKPLTGYNYYYRDERANIVSQMSGEYDPVPPPTRDFSVPKLQHLLYQHWYVDPVTKKRPHRKSHGKIDFQRLSKMIAERWHQLPDHGRDFYRAVAQYDTIYYNRHLTIDKQRPKIV